jgi:hypothetical protein
MKARMVRENGGKISNAPGEIDARARLPVNCASSLYGAISSAVEHCLHTAGVVGSNPTSPTILSEPFRRRSPERWSLFI